MFQGLYRIDALCPYCMVVWAVTIPLFWYTTLHNATAEHLRVTPRMRPIVARAAAYHGVVITGWFLVIAALITQRFWDYWSTLLTCPSSPRQLVAPPVVGGLDPPRRKIAPPPCRDRVRQHLSTSGGPAP